MAGSKRMITKLGDRDVINAFKNTADAFKQGNPVLSFHGHGSQLSDEEVERLLAIDGYYLDSISLKCFDWSFSWIRVSLTEQNQAVAMWDTLSTGVGNQSAKLRGAEVQAHLAAALKRPLLVTEKPETALVPIATHQEILAALEGAVAKVLVDSSQVRSRMDVAFDEKQRALEERYESERKRAADQVDKERERLTEEIAKRAADLEQKTAEIDRRERDLNNRNNTHVRREIRSSLLKLAEERLQNFTVSRKTTAQYWGLNAVSIVGVLGLSAAAIYYGAFSFASGADADTAPSLSVVVAAIVKSGLLLAAAIALGAWYLRWLNRWLQRIADAEFKLQQFRLDIERASWLAETVLEWRSNAQSEPFPEILATRLSAGLFQAAPSDVDDPKTPAGHLAEALFGAASSARLKLGNNEVNLDRKGIKSLQTE